MGVLAIWRYPVKATLDAVAIGPRGCAEVASAGRLRTGERLEVRRGHMAPRTVIDRAVIRLRDQA